MGESCLACILNMMFLTLLILFSLQLFAICDQDQAKSPHWVVVCEGSYLFSEDKKSWNDASDICELFGGHLAQIDNLAENYCLLDYAQSQEVVVCGNCTSKTMATLNTETGF